jgi:hypothetical protein
MSTLRQPGRLGLALVLGSLALPALAQVGPVEAARRGEGEIERGREKERIVEAAVRLAPDSSVEIEVRTPRGEVHRYRGTWSQGAPKQHRLRILELPGDPNPEVEGWVRVEDGHLERIEMNGRAHGGHRYTLAFEGSGPDLALPAQWSTLDVTETGWGELRQGDGSWGFDRLRVELRPDGNARLTAIGQRHRELHGRWTERGAESVAIELGEAYGDRGERGSGRIRLDRGRVVSAEVDGRDVRGPFRLEFRGGAAAPYPQRPDPSRPHRDDFSEEWGFDQPGGDYDRARAGDVAQCQQLCAGDARCRAYTFNTRDQTCYLKESERPLERRIDCVTGVKRMSSTGFSERPGYDLEGGDYASVYQPALEACQQACRSDRECAAYAYNTRTRICYLKDRVGVYVSRYEMVSGVKPRGR